MSILIGDFRLEEETSFNEFLKYFASEAQQC